MNTDGFRKKGCGRGEMWPVFLAVNDITRGKGCFREYSPQCVILSAVVQTSQKLTSSEFSALFERMDHELKETTSNPLKIRLNDVDYDVRLELFQSILDMDASRKIRGLPVWQSYGSCLFCDIQGSTLSTKTGRTIAWYSEFGATNYDENKLPTKLLPTCLPPPCYDGFDSLHVINEGTSKDLMKDILGNGKKTKFSIPKKIRLQWSKALNAATSTRGRSSAGLLDPIQLSTRTGNEIQQLYDLSIPILLIQFGNSTEWVRMIYLHWLLTRNVLNVHISIKDCDSIDAISPIFRDIVGLRFPSLYSMKFHVFLDHLVPTLRQNGSPRLSSAAPFERLNQTMGRSSNAFTTRTLMNIAHRFVAHKQAVEHITSTIKNKTMIPETMKESCEQPDTFLFHPEADLDQLEPAELNALNVTEETFFVLEEILRKERFKTATFIFGTNRIVLDMDALNEFSDID